MTTVFGETLKDKFENVKGTSAILDACLVKGNSKYIGVSWFSTGGGSLAILDNTKPARMDNIFPQIRGHNGVVMDFEFSPFNDNIVISASEDASIKLWKLQGPLTEDLLNADVTMQGHYKKVNLLHYNPSADNIIASASFDNTVKVWNIEKPEEEFSTLEGAEDAFMSIEWNLNGSLLATANRDKHLRIGDPRSKSWVHDWRGHEGPKGQRMCWLSPTHLFSVGFSKSYERQFFLWDINKLKEPVQSVVIDQQAGTMYPFFDGDTNVLYLGGKGDGNIRYYQFVDNQLAYLNQFTSTVPMKGLGFVPKRNVDVMKNELMRCLKLTANTLEYVSFSAMRKSEAFQDDLYPEALSDEPALNSTQWCEGKTSDPKRKSLKFDHPMNRKATVAMKKPEEKKEEPKKEEPKKVETNNSGEVDALKKDNADLKTELNRVNDANELLKIRVADLEKEVASLHEQLNEAKQQNAPKPDESS